jgi:two-component system nitrogen regulation response regulator NtrX
MTSIVVIDSEPTVRAVVCSILESGGYSVRGTGEFPEGLEMLRSEPPDLVVTNVFLREISGHDAMKVIRLDFPELPVLMVSGLPDEKVIADWMGEAGFHVFPKPFTSDALLERVRQILSSKAKSAED